jgi:hypothetical protein
MAIQFHPLPLEIFPDEARPYIARLNRELLELAGLEGVIRQPRAARRSDQSIVRRDEVQVDVSRITPTIAEVVSGASTVVGTPALVFGTANVVGTTSTAVSTNSQIALFGTATPAGVSDTGAVGTSGYAARADHRHAHTVFTSGDLHEDLLPRSGVRDMTGELGTDVGTFRSDVASGGVAFTFNSSNSFAAGDVFRFDDNASGMLAQSFEGHISTIRSEIATQTAALLHVQRTLVDDSRAILRGINVQPSVTGAIPGIVYTATHTGVGCALTFNVSDMPTTGTKTLNGGVFSAAINGGSTKTIATLRGGHFNVTDSGASMPVTNAYAGHFNASGTFAGGTVTNIYGIKTDAFTFGTNRWGGNFGNRVAITSPAADIQEVLNLTQSNTGGTTGSHIRFNDKAGTPTGLAAGDLWRNGSSLVFYDGAVQPRLAQLGTSATVTGHSAGIGGVATTDTSTFTGNSGSAAYTIGDVVRNLKDLGFLAA